LTLDNSLNFNISIGLERLPKILQAWHVKLLKPVSLRRFYSIIN